MEECKAPPTRYPLPEHVVHQLLAEARRRTVLAVLDARETPITLEPLARAVVARDRGVEPARVAPAAVEETAVMLHHADLPRLAAHEIVEYDPTAKAVDTAKNFDYVANWPEKAPR